MINDLTLSQMLFLQSSGNWKNNEKIEKDCKR